MIQLLIILVVLFIGLSCKQKLIMVIKYAALLIEDQPSYCYHPVSVTLCISRISKAICMSFCPVSSHYRSVVCFVVLSLSRTLLCILIQFLLDMNWKYLVFDSGISINTILRDFDIGLLNRVCSIPQTPSICMWT